ncbi:MAG: thioredoxin family protein [Candidatus Methanogaster sp.]|uniref:Thioredoxin family protein n=1 Tax=Candidatus Methanogaster sp. TaxID=3386292 RepID=A0AC61L3E2_9EURY|nr:MAG: thioredoxin family protein [ANME-2 cluster archaeon]
MDIIVKVFGSDPPCAKCKVAHDIAKKVSEKIGTGVVVEKHSALSEEGDKYGIMMTPTVVINDEIAVVGKAPSEKKLEEIIRSKM